MIIPIGTNLLLDPIPVEEQTSGGIFLPETARVTPDKGKIISCGEEVEDKENLKEGAVVLFRKNVGTSVSYKNKEYILLPTKEVIGVLKEDK